MNGRDVAVLLFGACLIAAMGIALDYKLARPQHHAGEPRNCAMTEPC